MSSFPGHSLEDLIEDNWGVSQGPLFDKLMAFYKPHRDHLEHLAGDFDDATQSWRTYRYMLWSAVPDFVIASED